MVKQVVIGVALIISGAGTLAALAGPEFLMVLGALWSSLAPSFTQELAWEYGKGALIILSVVAIFIGIGLTLTADLGLNAAKEETDEAVRPDRHDL